MKADNSIRDHRIILNWLMLLRKTDRQAKRLHVVLSSCKPGAPCRSAACPVCISGENTKLATAIIEKAEGGAALASATIVCSESIAQPGYLANFNYVDSGRHLKSASSKLELSWGLMVSTYSFIEQADRSDPHWVIAMRGVIAGVDPDELRFDLQTCFPPTKAIRSPVAVSEWDASSDLLSTDCDCLVQCDNQARFDPSADMWRIGPSVRHESIGSYDKIELLQHLHRIGSRRRIVMLKARLRREPDRWSLIPHRTDRPVKRKG